MDKKKGWKRFQTLKFSSAGISRRARRAETAASRHAHRFILKRLANLRDIRRHVSIWLLLVAGLAGAIVLQLSWYQGSYSQQAAVSGGTYAEAVQGSIDTLNPLYARSDAEITMRKLIFSSLLDYDKTGNLTSDLASNVAVSKNKRIYTVNLKPDLVWSDGSKLTAHDVVFTVGLMKNPETRAAMEQSWQDVNARVVDERTVEFQLPAPYAAFSDALTFSVLPEHILKNIEPSVLRESSFSTSPIGSGPFTHRLTQLVGEGSDSEHKISHMVANPRYHNSPIRLERFELHAYEKPQAMLNAAIAYDVNAVMDTGYTINTDKLPGTFVTEEKPINNGVYAFFNTDSAILKNAELRRALLAGTDIDKLRQAANASAPRLALPFIPQQIGADSSLSYLKPFNAKESARQLGKLGWKLQSNGLRKKKKQPLALNVVANKDAGYRPLLDELSRQWRSLGVDVKVTEFEQQPGGQSFAQSILQPRAYDVLLGELVIGADPDVFAYWHSSQAQPSGLNFSNYRNKLVDDILVSARQRDETTLRNEKYRAFAKAWSRDAPAIPLYQSTFRYAHTRKTSVFSGDAVMPSPANRLAEVDYWTADQGWVYKTP